MASVLHDRFLSLWCRYELRYDLLIGQDQPRRAYHPSGPGNGSDPDDVISPPPGDNEGDAISSKTLVNGGDVLPVALLTINLNPMGGTEKTSTAASSVTTKGPESTTIAATNTTSDDPVTTTTGAATDSTPIPVTTTTTVPSEGNATTTTTVGASTEPSVGTTATSVALTRTDSNAITSAGPLTTLEPYATPLALDTTTTDGTELVNLALGKEANQTCDFWNMYPAKIAVDGNTKQTPSLGREDVSSERREFWRVEDG